MFRDFNSIYRRYRDKDPAPAPVTTTPRAITPSEIKKPTINVTVNPKSLSTTSAPSLTTKPAKVTKKIDMGAATNFGRDGIGINSPTHRNTHAEEDLFATSNTTITTTTTANKTDLLDDIFKTCATTNSSETDCVLPQSNNDDDFFNPRDEESQEFGDFASAFGATTQTPPPPPPQQQQQQPTQPEPLVESNDTKKNEFADFGSAFISSEQTTTSNSNDPANLLFAINSTPNAQTTTSNSNPKVGDLLSDLDGLSLNVSVPTGKLTTQIFNSFFCFMLSPYFSFCCFVFILFFSYRRPYTQIQ